MNIQLTGSNNPFTANSSIFYNNGLKSTQEKLQRQADRPVDLSITTKSLGIIVFLRKKIVSLCDLH